MFSAILIKSWPSDAGIFVNALPCYFAIFRMIIKTYKVSAKLPGNDGSSPRTHKRVKHNSTFGASGLQRSLY